MPQPVPAAGAPGAFASRMRVYYEDTDAGGIVYYANWLRFLERARTDWLRALGVSQRALVERDGLVFVVRDLSIDYLRPARLDDEIVVDVRLAELKRASLRVAQAARLAGAGAAAPLVAASVRIAVVERASGRPAGLPAALHRTLLGVPDAPAPFDA